MLTYFIFNLIMWFLSLFDLPTNDAKKNQNIHLIIRNKYMVIMLMWTNSSFITYYVTSYYFYVSNIYTSAFTILIICKICNFMLIPGEIGHYPFLFVHLFINCVNSTFIFFPPHNNKKDKEMGFLSLDHVHIQ